ncbi:MAG: phosphomannomutase/phosphoglucomutase [Candidatus Muiribacteriota bacterium]|jgi:phosphomannomutase
MAGIFKAYDIRGLYPQELDCDTAYKIGCAYAQFIGKSPIVVGQDMRDTGDELAEALIKGINDMGLDVFYVGVVETPAINYSVNILKAAGGVMITASHNPAGYNGFKFCKEEAKPVSYETGINAVEKLVGENSFNKAEKKGSCLKKDIYESYIDYLISYVKNWKNMKVVIDAGNGMAGKTIPLFFEKLKKSKNINVEIIPLYFELDGNFPNHEANPSKEDTLEDLIKKVKETGADIGVAFDGDADRSGYVDETGRIVSSDYISTLISMEYLKTNPGSTILYDIRSTQAFRETVEKLGGIAKKTRVGHAYIKEALRKENAIFAGELSGHYYFRDNFYTDSGIIAMIQIFNLFCGENKKFSEIVNPLRKYFASGEINSKVSDPDKKIKEVEKIYSNGNIEKIDGLSIEFDTWWFNIRKSNTEPILRLNLEADTKEEMEKHKNTLLGIIRG